MTQTGTAPPQPAALTGRRGLRANRERLRLIRQTFKGWLLPTASIPVGVLLRKSGVSGPILKRLQPLTTTVTVRQHGLPIRTPLLDAWPVFEVFAFGEYGSDTISWPSLRNVIDCGAHVGSFALWLSRWSNASIVCVEPNPSVLPLLEHNVRSIKDRVRVWPLAIGGTAGTRVLHDQGFAAAASLERRSPRDRSVQVEAITLDELVERSGFATVDLLKMDIEGAEFEAFRTARPQTLARINAALIEWHPFAGQPDEIATKLEQAGMRVAHAPQMLIARRG
jgi:FkbM family methyltransferase